MPQLRDQKPDCGALAVPCAPDQVCRVADRILVVDDEASVRQVIVDVLSHDGYVVDAASDGPSALDHMARQRFRLVITDIVMPQMDGLTLIRTANQRGYQTAYIVMT
jgi:CheY-like chemotaxis protein